MGLGTNNLHDVSCANRSRNAHKVRIMSDTEDDQSKKDRKLKVVLVGDGTTGKSSLAQRFTQNQFGRAYQQTVGIDFFLKRIVLPGRRVRENTCTQSVDSPHAGTSAQYRVQRNCGSTSYLC